LYLGCAVCDVTFDVIFMFPNNVLAKFVDIICIFFYIHYPYFMFIALNINYQCSKLGYRRKIKSMLRHSSSQLQKYRLRVKTGE